MIIVTGATGTLGRLVVERLLAVLPVGEVGVSVREPDKAAELQARGVRVRAGDFRDAASLRLAFEGASRVLVISSNSSGADAVAHHRTAIEAARAVGAGRVVYTSHMGANADSRFAPMRDHAATEAILASSGLAFTALRNGFYVGSALAMIAQGLASGTIAAPVDGPVSWTTHADLADAAVIALTDARLDGVTSALTGSQALDLAAIAGLASERTGRSIQRVVVVDAEWRAQFLASGAPAERVELMVGLFEASRRGEFAAVDPALERLLGRPPGLLRDAL
ncbi:MAG: SDR family oxidoreductase [Kofleriaceae bacterium]